MRRNITLFPWLMFFQRLVFWQAVWFLFFQNRLSAADAVLLYAIYDIAATALEVPSGYMSDRLGRRMTLITSAVAGMAAMVFLTQGHSLALFAMAQILLGASTAFASGTDSALLYESLDATDRAHEIEAQELRAWRFSFTALALSAVIGGALSLAAPTLPFYAGLATFICYSLIALRLHEPPRGTRRFLQGGELVKLATLGAAFRSPVLLWLFALSVLMYVFSHIPFVFGQPFIQEALNARGFSAQAPLVSGVVSALMMILSLAVSAFAPGLRRWLGLPALLLIAFAMQIALAGVLALTNSALVIVILFFRMVPNALSGPFIRARIQPMLSSDSRATYLSLQSFAGRIIFAATLFVASRATSGEGQMPYADIQQILGWYVLAGLVGILALAISAKPARLEH